MDHYKDWTQKRFMSGEEWLDKIKREIKAETIDKVLEIADNRHSFFAVKSDVISRDIATEYEELKDRIEALRDST